MGKNQFWMIIAALVALNCFTVIFFLSKTEWASGDGETVATVGNESISKQEWINELETRYGKDTLRDLVDQKVVEQMAEKYHIKVSEQDVNRELMMMKSLYGTYGKQEGSEEKWKQQIKHSLLLEELLTRDAVIEEEELKSYYKQNKKLFDIPDSYHISQIATKSKKDAEQTLQELEQGSSFQALAMERSIDEFTANQGGDLGFVSEEDDRVPASVFNKIKELKQGKWSEPIETENGYTILFLHEKVPGKKYSYKEVKDQIRRQIALEQMDIPISAQTFWEEAKVDWLYGKGEKND
ncbi:putative PpiC-type peptidyl-prolyl cis-trans isomerase [Bacillus methanolicus PB1]|uniref:peptidylprolyl isomerase n=1 Tax=Bacillus methanolicus PB1 TaxID=997296 RepID=I3E0P4_BACMT|nr:peptidyl-prolyl cis-trans isomerase [Bacillus methanolicus]EIJ80065.1 putative PpiC-type peptidyl-prolyl cis-trans isomerase [Bacillus methanolicus PB1]